MSIKSEDQFAVWIIEETLSDGSKGYAVEIGETKFDCVTHDAAAEFAQAFCELLEEHTNIEAAVFES